MELGMKCPIKTDSFKYIVALYHIWTVTSVSLASFVTTYLSLPNPDSTNIKYNGK